MNQTQSDSCNWFVCPLVNPSAETRLFIFPYAGGSPAAFWKWAAGFQNSIETLIAHYPGRGSRSNEPPIKQISILVDELYQAIQPFLEKPFHFYGHSLGGLVAFELIRTLRQNKLPQPTILFVSACGAPQLPDQYAHIHTLPDVEFLKALQELNGTPAEILNHPELMELLLPAFRADFEAFEKYNFISKEPPLSCPIVAFGGKNDPRVSSKLLEAWAAQTSSTFKAYYFPGDHFFINAMKESVMRSIVEETIISGAHEQESG